MSVILYERDNVLWADCAIGFYITVFCTKFGGYLKVKVPANVKDNSASDEFCIVSNFKTIRKIPGIKKNKVEIIIFYLTQSEKRSLL